MSDITNHSPINFINGLRENCIAHARIIMIQTTVCLENEAIHSSLSLLHEFPIFTIFLECGLGKILLA